MKVIKITKKLYVCEVCETAYENDKKSAKRCEKLPVEEKMFKKGDKVKILLYANNKPDVAEVVSVKLYSTIDNEDMTERLGISRRCHFYLYAVKVNGKGLCSYMARYLRKI